MDLEPLDVYRGWSAFWGSTSFWRVRKERLWDTNVLRVVEGYAHLVRDEAFALLRENPLLAKYSSNPEGLLCPGMLVPGVPDRYTAYEGAANSERDTRLLYEVFPETRELLYAKTVDDLYSTGLRAATSANRDNNALEYLLRHTDALKREGELIAADGFGHTSSLHMVTLKNQERMVRLMLETADRVCPWLVRARDDFGRTPLHYAAAFGPTDNIQAFLEHPEARKDLTTVDSNGRTPLQIAIKGNRSYSRTECLELLTRASGGLGSRDLLFDEKEDLEGE
jgi:hypothetical protein